MAGSRWVGHVITAAESPEQAGQLAADHRSRLEARMFGQVADTGRIRSPLSKELQGLLFGQIDEAKVQTEVRFYAHVDIAHLRMLRERGIIAAETERRLQRCISDLIASDFQALRGVQALRGSYLSYEEHVTLVCGAAYGGVMQAGRSRNDLNATVARLRAREVYTRVVGQACDLAELCVQGIEMGAGVLMPAYTQYQTAFPCSWGHYLHALAEQFVGQAVALEAAFEDIDRSPLGSCAGGGTSIPIDPIATARSLGFSGVVSNSVEGVACREFALRVLAETGIIASSVSRLAVDLALWSTNEFGLVALPDELVGSSSNMPQKRNPFLLEHVKGRSAAVVAALSAAFGCMQCPGEVNCSNVVASSSGERGCHRCLRAASLGGIRRSTLGQVDKRKFKYYRSAFGASSHGDTPFEERSIGAEPA